GQAKVQQASDSVDGLRVRAEAVEVGAPALFESAFCRDGILNLERGVYPSPHGERPQDGLTKGVNRRDLRPIKVMKRLDYPCPFFFRAVLLQPCFEPLPDTVSQFRRCLVR